ncbi:regulator [Anditalea andensis]|uniref:Regulator n=1 Tax=Anditalea andensis TaxID=1048983 RepID=A0A074LNR7_9BACT|nr:regulator [Anditalea andensis]
MTLVSKTYGQQLGLPFSKYYSSHEYKGGIQNFAFTQSESGLIYVANNFGLLEYDGTTWRRYSLPNSTKIRDIFINDNGFIYTAGQGEFGYFYPNENGSLLFHSLVNELPEVFKNLGEVWKIFKHHDKVYFCTSEHIFIYDEQAKYSGIISSKSTFESFHLANNLIIINEWESGLQTIVNEVLIPMAYGTDLGDKLVTGIIPQTNEHFLIFTRDDGIFLQGPGGIESWKVDIPLNAKINKAFRLKDGTIAVGTQNDGIYVINEPNKITLHLDKQKGLQNNTILSFFEDIAGNLWMGHNNGITLLELNLPFRHIDQSSGLPGTGYDAHLIKNKIYYGTNYGVFVQSQEEEKASLALVPGTTGQVYWISDIQNQLLIGHNDGAFHVHDEKANLVEGANGIWNFHQLKGHSNLIISGGYNGLYLLEKHGDHLKLLRKLKGFNESSRIMEQDDDGNIWMTHGYKGVYKLKLNKNLDSVEATFYSIENGLPSNLWISVWKINNRLLFTTEQGIYTYNALKDTFERDTQFIAHFPDGELITSMVEDPLGNIFYIGNNEVGVLEKQVNGSYEKNHQIFNKIKHLLNDDLQNIALIKSNEVLFAAKEGFIWYRLEQKKQVAPSYPTMIRSVYLTGLADSIIYQGNYKNHREEFNPPKLDYHLGSIRFEFSNPIPNQESSTQFQFMLEGLEEDFGEWTKKRDKAYTHLREGNYVFHVRSKNLYGELGIVDSYAFSIAPPWYRSALAYIIYAILISSALFYLYKFLDQKHRQRAAIITEEQQKTLIQKEIALKDSHEEIERLRNEKLQAQIQAKNKELASATMHLINKNGFIDHVKSGVTAVMKKTKNQEVRHELEKVVHSIEKNIAGDADWEQFEIHFDQVHGDFIHRFKKEFSSLSPQEIKLSAYLRMNLSSKEIAYLMNISTRGIEIARYRLRKKLQLDRTDNLQEFILKF